MNIAKKKLYLILRLFLVVTLLPFFITSCNEDQNETKLQYFPDMADSPAIKTGRSYIDPPINSVPTNAIIYPDSIAQVEKVCKSHPSSNSEICINTYKSPPDLVKGKHLYQTFCEVCHGPNAQGKGPVSSKLPPPDITSDYYKSQSDGFFFYRVTFGKGNYDEVGHIKGRKEKGGRMPSYGHAITPHERWQIVSYLRKLQNK